MQLKQSKKQKWEATGAFDGSGGVVPPAPGELCFAVLGGLGVGGVKNSRHEVEATAAGEWALKQDTGKGN